MPLRLTSHIFKTPAVIHAIFVNLSRFVIDTKYRVFVYYLNIWLLPRPNIKILYFERIPASVVNNLPGYTRHIQMQQLKLVSQARRGIR